MHCAPSLCYKFTDDSRSCPGPSGSSAELCLSVPMLCPEHPWKPWAVGSCHQQTNPASPAPDFLPFLPGILSLLPSLRNKPWRYKTTSERDLAQQRWLQSNMLRMREEWHQFDLGQVQFSNLIWNRETNRPPCKTISIGFQTSTSLSAGVYTEIW